MWKSWPRPTRWTRNSKPSGYALTVTKTGTGSGTVTSSPAGINCGATCSAKFTSGVTVTLAATPAAGSTFVGWSGACTGTGACTVSMTASKTVTATFNTTTAGTYALTLYKIGTGLGTVASNPAGINCGTGCVANFTSGRLVTLTATPTTGSTFTGWGGACAGTARTCTVTMSAARVVTATFNRPVLTIAKVGTGSGLITGTGINCGVDCTEPYNLTNPPLTVTLTAAAYAGSTLHRLEPAARPWPLIRRQCTVTMNTSKTVKATFNTTTPGTNRPHALQDRRWLGHGHQQPRRHQLRRYLRRRRCLLRDWRHRHPHRHPYGRLPLRRLDRLHGDRQSPTCRSS